MTRLEGEFDFKADVTPSDVLQIEATPKFAGNSVYNQVEAVMMAPSALDRRHYTPGVGKMVKCRFSYGDSPRRGQFRSLRRFGLPVWP